MTDTEILTQLCANMRSYWVTGVPLPPARIKQWAVWVDERRKEQPGCRRQPDHQVDTNVATQQINPYTGFVNGVRVTGYDNFWRCRHHPEAIHNWSGKDICEHGCDKSDLRWYDHGVNAPRGTVLYSTTTLGQPPKAYEYPKQGYNPDMWNE